MKQKTIGRLSLTGEAYKHFEKLPYKQQLEQVYESLSPKDYVQAEKALKGIPNGDTKSEDSAIRKANPASSTGGNAKNNTEVAGTDKGESK